MINLIAILVALAGILAVAGDSAYLMLLDKAAKTRGLAGAQVNRYVSSQWKTVGAVGGVSLLALLMTTGGTFMDILAILLAAGAGTMAVGHLGKVRQKYGNPPSIGS